MLKKLFALLLSICVAGALLVGADTLKLKDGTSVHGKVMDQGSNYWFKADDGTTKLIAKDEVTSWDKDSAAAKTETGQPTAGGNNFANVKFKAAHAESAIQAVGLWQSFIDANPTGTDLPAAKEELKRWKELSDGNAVKINGKWVGGDDLKKLQKQVKDLTVEALTALHNNQTLVGINKFEDVLKIYPDSFTANFELGYFYLVEGLNTGKNLTKIDKGIKSLEAAARLQPRSAATLSNLAIGYNFRQKYKQAVISAYEAAKIEDSKDLVQNLMNALYYAPEGMRKNDPTVRPIAQDALLLGGKYGLAFGSEMQWMYIRPHKRALVKGSEKDEAKGPAGIIGNGSGFFISDDGYIITNRHVAKEGDYLVACLSDGTMKVAERVIIDDEQDLAILHIKTTAPVPFIPLAPYEHPPTGADVAVFGFPLQGAFGSTVKMTRGIVTAYDQSLEGCDVTVDAQINPGNSGGPMVDKHGNLMAVSAQKTFSSTFISSYGMGISIGRVQKFLLKQKEKLKMVNSKLGKDTGFALGNEKLAQQITPATVCIYVCRGTPPDAAGPVDVKPAKRPEQGGGDDEEDDDGGGPPAEGH